MKLFKAVAASAVLAALTLTACGGDDNNKTAQASSGAAAPASSIPETLKVGVVPGPYRGMIDKFVKPILEKQGHKLEFVEFTDYVQPDAALDSGDIDVNLMQHQSYLDGIVKNQGLKLVSVINVPTLGLGVFSDKYKTLDEIPDGAKVGIPADAVNLARALRIAKELGIVTLKAEKDEQKAAIADVDQNPKHLVFVPMEAAQISRSLDSIDLGFVPGNYAYAAGLDYSKALGIENVIENIKNVVAVRQKDEQTIGKLFKDAISSDEFVKALNADPAFDAFSRPQWWPSK